MVNEIKLEKLIPSNAVRKQCEKEGRIFDLREQAALVWNNPELSNRGRLELLEEIKEEAGKDLVWQTLKIQIEERIKIQKELEKKFFSTEEKQYFKISYRDKQSKTFETERILFSDAEKASDYAFKELAEFALGNEFKITKLYLDSTDEVCAVYSGWNEISDIYSFSFDPIDTCDKYRFENAFVLLPHPFRLGDFVRTMGCEKIGIFRGCRTEEDYLKEQAFYKKLEEKGLPDFTDVCCTAEYLESCYDNKKQFCFSHNHPCLINLEFAEIKEEDPHYELMKQAQLLVRGKGSLDIFSAEILKI